MRIRLPFTSVFIALLSLFLLPSPSAHAALTSAPASHDSSPPLINLNDEAHNPSSCPAWAKEQLPAWLTPYMGVNGEPARWREGDVIAPGVQGVDRYQANHFIWYTPATTQYLLTQYTPLTVHYKKGALPSYEKIVARYTAGLTSDTAKAVTLLTKAMPRIMHHPVVPILGPDEPPGRNLSDEALLASHCGWCNEQARVFIRLCQVCGIPARIVHLFGESHTLAEFHADGRWAMADASFNFVTPGKDGKLLSAVQCHDLGEGQRYYVKAKQKRIEELLKMSDQELGFTNSYHAQRWREDNEDTADMGRWLMRQKVSIGTINYPLPR